MSVIETAIAVGYFLHWFIDGRSPICYRGKIEISISTRTNATKTDFLHRYRLTNTKPRVLPPSLSTVLIACHSSSAFTHTGGYL
jgi:hypothetical protein